MHAASRLRLATVLAKQQDVITFGQVIAAGVDGGLPGREVAAGRWQLILPGIYLATDQKPTDLQLAWVAQLAGGEGAVVTGGIACRILGVADVPELPLAALVAQDRQRDPGDQARCLRTARPADFLQRGGLRIAEHTRAVVDAARMCASLQDGRGLVMAALNAKHTTPALLRAELDAGPRRGSGHCRRALDDWDDGARSAPEAEVADWLRDEVRARRCPPFLLNPMVYVDGVLVGCPDLYVVGTDLGNETDSRRHHGSTDDLDATLQRHAAFTAAGFRLEHVTPGRFREDPAGWARAFAALARDRGGQEPPRAVVVPVGPEQPVPGRRRRSPSS